MPWFDAIRGACLQTPMRDKLPWHFKINMARFTPHFIPNSTRPDTYLYSTLSLSFTLYLLLSPSWCVCLSLLARTRANTFTLLARTHTHKHAQTHISHSQSIQRAHLFINVSPNCFPVFCKIILGKSLARSHNLRQQLVHKHNTGHNTGPRLEVVNYIYLFSYYIFISLNHNFLSSYHFSSEPGFVCFAVSCLVNSTSIYMQCILCVLP